MRPRVPRRISGAAPCPCATCQSGLTGQGAWLGAGAHARGWVCRAFGGILGQNTLLPWGERPPAPSGKSYRRTGFGFILRADGSSSSWATLAEQFPCNYTTLTFLFAVTVSCKTGGISFVKSMTPLGCQRLLLLQRVSLFCVQI